jgi:uncharacterized membrane protein YhhN
MKMEMQLANPLLVFIYSLSLLVLGCAVGIYWHATPSIAVGLAIAGASLMVLHDTLTSLIWFWIAAKWSQYTARGMQNKSH